MPWGCCIIEGRVKRRTGVFGRNSVQVHGPKKENTFLSPSCIPCGSFLEKITLPRVWKIRSVCRTLTVILDFPSAALIKATVHVPVLAVLIVGGQFWWCWRPLEKVLYFLRCPDNFLPVWSHEKSNLTDRKLQRISLSRSYRLHYKVSTLHVEELRLTQIIQAGWACNQTCVTSLWRLSHAKGLHQRRNGETLFLSGPTLH